MRLHLAVKTKRLNETKRFLPCDALRCTVFVIVILSVCPSVDSAPARSLLFFVVDSVAPFVRLFVTLLQIDSSSLFLDGIRPFLGHQYSMTKATKRCSSNFHLLPWQRNLGYFCKKFQIASSFLFSDGIEPFFGS